ncbi:phosphatidylinositol kinase [Frondihabitans sp. PAMC 28766]|nr:phosphatidylinositol kinase [Frondihabitans sp. PAMC 28766]
MSASADPAPSIELLAGPLEIVDRITIASNATFVGRIGETEVVYKPIMGEQPLWDFPDGDLGHREAAAYLVSEAFGWDIVPRTWLRDGPLGVGMVQLWQDVDPAQDAVDIKPVAAVPGEGWRLVFEGYDDRDRPVALVHEDSAELRRMAVFDVVVNNADRKGGHILEMPGGHRHGIDHGLTFHEDHKLRTVLWGWAGEPLLPDELARIEAVRQDLDAALGETLTAYITVTELVALADRCEHLLQSAAFPHPRGRTPATPYPLF